MSAMDEFKKVLEEMAAKRAELQVYEKQVQEIYEKTQPLHQEMEILYERKRLAEAAFLMEVEAEVTGD